MQNGKVRGKKGSGPLTRTEMVVIERPLRNPNPPELKTLEDYREYNKEARANGWRVKLPPPEVHETRKVKVMRLDGQGKNPIKVKLASLAHGLEIDYQATIVPGKAYELPLPIIKHLQSKKYPQYAEVKKPNGESETVFTHDDPRFSISDIYE